MEIKIGNKCYAKKVSIHVGGNEFVYAAPKGKKFALILMGDEKPNNADGIDCNDFLRECGWEQQQ